MPGGAIQRGRYIFISLAALSCSRNLTTFFIWQRDKLETRNIYTRPQARHFAMGLIIWSPVVPLCLLMMV